MRKILPVFEKYCLSKQRSHFVSLTNKQNSNIGLFCFIYVLLLIKQKYETVFMLY